MIPPRDDERGRDALTQLDEAFAPERHEDDTRHNLRAVRSTLSEVQAMHVAATVAREQDAESRRKLAWKVGGASVPLIITALVFSARVLFALGGVDEQQAAMRSDVSRVLTVVERLDRAGVSVETRLTETERALREVEKRAWEARQREPRGNNAAALAAP